MSSTFKLREFAKFDEDEENGKHGRRTHRSLPWLASIIPPKFDLLFLESDAFLKRCKNAEIGVSDSDGMDALLPVLPAYLHTDSAADILQTRIAGFDAHDPDLQVPDLAKLLPRVLWKRLLFAGGLYVLQVIFSLASPLVTFALLRWAEDKGRYRTSHLDPPLCASRTHQPTCRDPPAYRPPNAPD